MAKRVMRKVKRQGGRYTKNRFLGQYNGPIGMRPDRQKAIEWLYEGVQPADNVVRRLSFRGLLYLKHLLRSVKLGLFDEATARERFATWSTEHTAYRKISKPIEINSGQVQAAEGILDVSPKEGSANSESLRLGISTVPIPQSLLAHAIEVCGSYEAAMQWLNEKSIALGYVSPTELIRTKQGVDEVQRELTRIEAGVL